MKNTFVKVLLAFLFALSLIGLVACKEKSSEETAHEHVFSDWKITQEASLNEEGTEKRFCSCGEVEVRTIATTPTSIGLKYTINDDGITCTIRGIGTCKDTKIVIGQTIDGYRVTAIGLDAFFNCTTITDVTIADNVTSIGNSAFFSCTNLTSVTLPATLTTLGESAFNNCTSLVSVNIPQGVTTIKFRTFYNCSALKSIHIPDSVTVIENAAFRNCSALEEISIPASVKALADGSFNGCNKLLEKEGGITYIDTWAIEFDGKSTSVALRDGTFGLMDELFAI